MEGKKLGSKKLGLVQVYTGNGKGKTTAALGLAVRAVGQGLRVYMIQFMKGSRNYGELKSSKKLNNFKILQYGRNAFVDKKNPLEIDKKYAKEGLAKAKEIMKKGICDILILDEINVAVDYNLISVEDVINLIRRKPNNVELILTGRYANGRIVEIADLVTEMKEIKHPYKKGVKCRKGIDY